MLTHFLLPLDGGMSRMSPDHGDRRPEEIAAMEAQANPSAQYEITIRIECPHAPDWIAKIAGLISDSGGAIGAIDLVRIHKRHSLRDYSIECTSTEHANEIVRNLGGASLKTSSPWVRTISS
jgi:(p)ppGpp synthase/HD superfamily hydrolase